MPPNQVLTKAVVFAASSAAVTSSRKMTDSPGAMLVTPLKTAPKAEEFELSSTFQLVIVMVFSLMLVSSNQSSATALKLFAQGAVSEMITTGTGAVSGSWSVTVRTKFNVASGVAPSERSSALMVTA